MQITRQNYPKVRAACAAPLFFPVQPIKLLKVLHSLFLIECSRSDSSLDSSVSI